MVLIYLIVLFILCSALFIKLVATKIIEALNNVINLWVECNLV